MIKRHCELEAFEELTVLCGKHTLIVDCCLECNMLLSNSIQSTLNARKTELKRRLVRKYKKILSTPHWSEAELNELGPDLLFHIQTILKVKTQIKARLAY